MRYLVYGAGGTGGSLAAFLALGGKQVSLIARGSHLEALLARGLVLAPPSGPFVAPVEAHDQEHTVQPPDVIFLCVKGYSLEGTIPTLQRLCGAHTIVIPLLNLYGTGGRLQPALSPALVTDGCIYIAAEIKAPGLIHMSGDIFRVVFGPRTPAEYRPELETIAQDLKDCGIRGELSQSIQRDALLKFSYVSPMAACGIYHNQQAAGIQVHGQPRTDFIELISEVSALAAAMGFPFPKDPIPRNLAILDALDPDASTSLKRDLDAGRPSEVDGLIFEVVRLGRKYGVPTPLYDKVAASLGFSMEDEI